MLQHLLRLPRHSPAVTLESVRKESYSEALIQELHAVSSSLMAESLEHFHVHALANDLVHVFRRADTGRIIGFQFWRTAPISTALRRGPMPRSTRSSAPTVVMWASGSGSLRATSLH